MQKVLNFSLVFLLFNLATDSAKSDTSNHLLSLNSKFPYGLLGDDYGILPSNDLALDACYFDPKPFAPGEIHPYGYWQCFESKNIFVSCEEIGFWEDVGGTAARVVVDAYTDQALHEFIEARPWSHNECKSFLKSLRRIMKGTSHSCISGSNIRTDKNKNGKDEFIGIFGRLKTRKGCEGANCELTEKVKREHCPGML